MAHSNLNKLKVFWSLTEPPCTFSRKKIICLQNGEPCKVGVAMTDLATGLYAHGAIMAALLQRNQTGKGQKINCDLLSTQVSTLVNLGLRFQKSFFERDSLKNSLI